MPGGDLKSLGLSLCLPMGMNAHLSEHEQGGPTDINELDNLLPGLLECPPHCDSWVREEGASPSRSRRCKWGRNPWKPLSLRR